MMIRAWKHALLLVLCGIWLVPQVQGQRKDFQTWWELDLHKEVAGGFDFAVELEQRFRNNSLQYDRSLVTLTGSYRANRYLGVEAGLRAVAVQDREQQIQSKFRAHADAEGNYSLSGIDFSFRVRLQYGFDDIVDLGFFRINTLVNRNRLKLEHHLFGSRVTIFGSVESWHLLNEASSGWAYKMRYSGGLEYALGFASRLKLRYILEDEFNVRDPLQTHVLLLGYRRDF
jgi:hypothetical protein